MVGLYKKKVVLLDADEKARALRELWVQILLFKNENELRGSLKTIHIDLLISRCRQDDMSRCKFLRDFVAAKPTVKSLVLIDCEEAELERRIRSLGVTAVLNVATEDTFLRDFVSRILGILPTLDKTYPRMLPAEITAGGLL